MVAVRRGSPGFPCNERSVDGYHKGTDLQATGPQIINPVRVINTTMCTVSRRQYTRVVLE